MINRKIKYIVMLLAVLLIPANVNGESKYLYDVLKNEATSGGFANEYTGEHKDSFTNNASKSIYYIHSTDDELLNANNNISFGGFCWQFYRTTDTGGTKVIYNGVAKDKYEIIPYDKDEYTVNNNYDYIWDESDKSWNLTIPANSGKTLYITTNSEKEYVVEMSVTPSDGSFIGSYITFYDGNNYVINEDLKYGKYGYAQYDFGTLSAGKSFFVSYSAYDNTSTSELNIKVKIGEKGKVIGSICNNRKREERNIGNEKYNNVSNSIAYVGYMYNPSSAVVNKGWSSGSGFVFGNDVTYSNGVYTLQNTSNTLDDTHHYTCLSTSTTCANVAYFYYNYYYTELQNGLKIEDAVRNMLYSDNVNSQSSNIKGFIDNWYSNNLTDYSEYLEDTIFCNNRKLLNYDGWKKDGTLSSFRIMFADAKNSTSLMCPNVTDQFSLSNPKAKLIYPVALMTVPERRLIGITQFLNYTNEWSMTPYYVSDGYISAEVARISGDSISNDYLGSQEDVRPVISFKPSTEYRKGTGKRFDPYIIKVLNTGNIDVVNDEEKGLFEINSTENIKEESNVTFSVKPNVGYKVSRVEIKDTFGNIINYNKVNNSYSFVMPETDVTISVIYENDTFSVNVEIKNETKSLEVNIEDLTQIEYEKEVKFKVTPIKGYKINNIKIVDALNNEVTYSKIDNTNEYTFIMPASNITIIPAYEKVSNSVIVIDNKNTKQLTIEVEDAKAIVYEEKVKFKVIPDDNYEVDKIEITDTYGNNVRCKSTGSVNEYEFTMPDTDVVIKPVYKIINNSEDISNPKTGINYYIILVILLFISTQTYLVLDRQKNML